MSEKLDERERSQYNSATSKQAVQAEKIQAKVLKAKVRHKRFVS
jgi:hypothetical protein